MNYFKYKIDAYRMKSKVGKMRRRKLQYFGSY